jgi:hypothetical protein
VRHIYGDNQILSVLGNLPSPLERFACTLIEIYHTSGESNKGYRVERRGTYRGHSRLIETPPSSILFHPSKSCSSPPTSSAVRLVTTKMIRGIS